MGVMQSDVEARVTVTVEHEPGIDPCRVVRDCLYNFEASPGRGDEGTIVASEITGCTTAKNPPEPEPRFETATDSRGMVQLRLPTDEGFLDLVFADRQQFVLFVITQHQDTAEKLLRYWVKS